MAPPPRVFYTLIEAAARWGCSIPDIVAHATARQLALCTAIPLVSSNNELVDGLVQLHSSEFFPLIRRNGGGPRSIQVRRIRLLDAEPSDWKRITEPGHGIQVDIDDLVIMASEAHRFEETHEIFRRAHAGTGPEPRYGWVELLQWLAVRLHEEGVPATFQELIDEARQWFIDRSEDGNHPGERSIRRYLTPVWKQLKRGDDPV